MSRKKKSICLFFQLLFCISCVSTKTGAPSGELELARQFISTGDYKAATAQLQNLRRKYPEDFTVPNLLGTAYLGFGDLKASQLAFQQSTELNPENYDAFLNLAYTQILSNKLTEARKSLDIIIEGKNYAYMERVYINYGLSYLQGNDCAKAMGYFGKTLEIDPTFSGAYFNQGKCHFLSKKYGQAIQSFQKAANFCSNCSEPVMELARSYYFSGQKKMALQKLESLLNQKLDKVSEQKTRNLIAQFSK